MQAAAIALLLVLSWSSAAPTDNCGSEKLACGQRLILYGSETYLPEDTEGVLQACKEELAAEECSRSFADECLEGFPRGVALIVMDAVKDELLGKCNTSLPRHKQYMEHIGCLNKAGVGLNGCIQDVLGRLYYIAEQAPSRKKIAFACCQYGDFRECLTNTVNDKCGNSETLAYLDSVLDNLMGELLDLVCSNYKRGSNRCLQLPPLGYDKDFNAGRTLDFLGPMVSLAQSLG